MKKLIIIIAIMVFFLGQYACKKSEYLDAKPDQSLIIPETIEELQTLLDNTNVMNGTGQGLVPGIAEVGSDNYYMIRFSPSTIEIDSPLYIWSHQLNIPNTSRLFDWDNPYRCIFYSNIVLEGLNKITPQAFEMEGYNNVKGSALFHRAHMFYQLAQVFAPVYDEASAENDPGIPLKLDADINVKVNRPSLRATYELIIGELKQSIGYLPVIPKYPTRPSQPAAYALLARTYQSMQKYDSSLYYANECLKHFNTLIDFNDNTVVDTAGTLGIRKRYNPEIIFHSKLVQTNIDQIIYAPTAVRVDSVLYASYDLDDKRKTVFFRAAAQGYNFKGSYEANNRAQFGGIAADEVYLIRAEAYARKGMVTEAMADLNTLMVKRWRTGVFTPFTAADPAEALAIILRERRKELVFRSLRWMDLRRLNKEGANIELKRKMSNGQIYTLAPNDKRYTYLIPYDVMQFNSGWQQNPR